MNAVLEALRFRHACKKFDPERTIPEETIREIMQAAHVSPSSFGLQPWKFLVISDKALRQEMRPLCWNQAQVTDCSHLVVILTRREKTLKPGSRHMREVFASRGFDEEQLRAYFKRLENYYWQELIPYMNFFAWGSKQCYIALADIMAAAAAAQVDSCPLEGFDKSALDHFLHKKLPDEMTDDFGVAVLCALGYRHPEWRQPPRSRLPFDEVVRFIG